MHNSDLEILIPERTIQEKIANFAHQLNEEYRGKEFSIVFVMKGAICFVADLIRHLEIPFTLDFIQAKSYGLRGAERGELKILGLENLSLTSKDVLLIDDICDTGNTLLSIQDQIWEKKPRSIRSIVLLSKKISKVSNYSPDDALFEIEDQFVVGYGLDYKELFRGLPNICLLKNP